MMNEVRFSSITTMGEPNIWVDLNTFIKQEVDKIDFSAICYFFTLTNLALRLLANPLSLREHI